MARRTKKGDSALITALIVIGLPIYAVTKVFDAVGWIVPALVVLAIITLVVWFRHAKKRKRIIYLRNKYHDEQVVQRIFNGYFWEGQSAEQLRDSLGSPVAVDKKLLKTISREIWKYQHQGGNRFALRITVENGYVSGWDQKA